MMEIDIRTVYLIAGLLYIILPVATWLALSGRRSHAIALWCGGGVVLGVAIFLLSLRGVIPDALTLPVGNVLFIGGLLIRIQALRVDLSVPWRLRWMGVGVLVYLAVFSWTHYVLQSVQVRVLFVVLVTAVLLFYMASLCLQLGRERQSQNAYWMAGIQGLVGFFYVIRLILVSLGWSSADPQTSVGVDLQIIPVLGVLSAVVSNIGYVGMVLDQSVREEIDALAAKSRTQEQHRLGEQLALLDRQRSLVEMSASLGHELNQPLTAMLTNAQVAQRGLRSGRLAPEHIAELLHKITQNTARAGDIIEKLRGFSHPSEVAHERLDLNLLARSALQLAGPGLQGVTMVFVPSAAPMWVRGDVTQLSQVLVNLYRNAGEALQHTVCREIYVCLMHLEGRVLLSVCDTGAGLTPQALERAGTPFYTTKTDGLGMGLAISRKLIEQHGGTLSVGPACGGGACADINLPAWRDADASAASARLDATRSTAPQT